MESIKELLKIGVGPSSSHTYGPKRAALKIAFLHPKAIRYEVFLYGSLSLTGKGHLTDAIIEEVLGKENVTIHFEATTLEKHANGMKFVVYENKEVFEYVVYSIGGGTILFDGQHEETIINTYPHQNLGEVIKYMEENAMTFYDYVCFFEGEGIEEYLYQVLDSMFQGVEEGLKEVGELPGSLRLKRVARSLHQQAMNTRNQSERERLLISSYAYAVSEQNASGNTIVTAPTCGASGVLPAILYYCYKQLEIPESDLIKALAVAGVFGNVIKKNATISGAQGGCQAEIGSACAMAAASYGWILELNNSLIEYAAEMGLEHNLGLTCDPVGGYVQIPCIERNGFAALRAMDAAMYAKQLGYLRENKVSFDAVVRVMNETGKDLNSAYKETSLGGLAKEFEL